MTRSLTLVIFAFVLGVLISIFFLAPHGMVDKVRVSDGGKLLPSWYSRQKLEYNVAGDVINVPPQQYVDKPVSRPDEGELHRGQQQSTMEHDTVTEPPPNLPLSVIDGVKTFIFFVGHPCSGHSIVGSLIDSHPHMVVANEYSIFRKLSAGWIAPTKQKIFNTLWKESQHGATAEGSRTAGFKGYTLFVDDLYQGTYVDRIDVIGDKQGGYTIQMLRDSPSKWSRVYNILRSLNVTLKVIHVIRNPYDNIATLSFIGQNGNHTFGDVKRANKTRTFSSKHMKWWIAYYFHHHEAIIRAKNIYDLDIFQIHGRDLISDPKGILLKLCNYLGVTCSDHYLEFCNKKMYKNTSRTRHLVNWTEDLRNLIQQKIENYSFLKGYNYNSA